MNFKITTLVENAVAQSGQALLAELGLSFYIEAGDRKILFDTGQNLAISNNARVLGIELNQIDKFYEPNLSACLNPEIKNFRHKSATSN